MTSLKLQRLWETLARASAAEGGVAAVEREVCRQLDALTCADLCVDPSPSTAASGSAPPVITTQSVYESDAFDIVVFVFPANAAIPLHDHPAMTVFSKVLYGALAMVSFDWAAPPSVAELDAFTREQARLEELAAGAPPTPDGRGGGAPAPLPPRPAVQRADTILTPEAPTAVLRPTFANIHAFRATTHTAVVDVLLPPYDEANGRDCHYFERAPPDAGGAVRLRASAAPEDLVIRRGTYRGPRIVEEPL